MTRPLAALAALLLALGAVAWMLPDRHAAQDPGAAGSPEPPGRTAELAGGGPTEPGPPRQEPSGIPETDLPADVPRFELNGQRDFLLVLRALGTSLEDVEAWARTRGFPPATFTTGVGIPLDQPYRRYDQETLRELAAAGDRWAMQFLAADLRVRAPLESMELYREAAVGGSVFAARELGMLMRDLDLGVRTSTRMDDATRAALKQMDAAHDLAETGLAWLIAAEAEGGLPPGYLSADAVENTWPDTLARACEEAAGLLANLAEERRNRGLGDPARMPPPFSVAPPGEGLDRACPEGVVSDMRAKGCVPVLLTAGDKQLTGWRCSS